MALLYLLLRELRSNVELLSNSVPLTSLFLKGRKVTVSVIILTLSGNHTNGPLISRDVEKRRGGRRIEIRPPLHRVCRPLALGEAFSLGCKLYITFVIVTQSHQIFFAMRYLQDVVQTSLGILHALGQRQANLP